MESSSVVRSVVRAVDLLQALNRQSVSTLDTLHAQTGIPKPTLVRLLQTLETCGMVQHASQHGAYFLTSGVRSLSCGYHSEPMLVEAAAPYMDELTRRVKWPLAVGLLDDTAMVVRYSTIPLSPLAMRHSTINMRLSLVSRAIGRAYLAFCSPEEHDALLHSVRQSPSAEDLVARDNDRVRAILAKVKQDGYALRDPQVGPVTNTLAVPLFDARGVVAALGMTFFSSTMRPEQAVDRYLRDLREVASQVSRKLAQLQA